MTTHAAESKAVNRNCYPPYDHAENCRCAEREAEEAEDIREALMDRWEM